MTKELEIIDVLFPNEITRETNDRDEQEREVEYRIRPQPGYNALILFREPNSRRDDGIQRKEQHREGE